jgi:hypothetical protein
MYKLRHTWTQYSIFSPTKLNQLDRRIQSIDPNWPVTPITTSQQQQQPTAHSKPSKILINPAKFPQVYIIPPVFTGHLKQKLVFVSDPYPEFGKVSYLDPDPEKVPAPSWIKSLKKISSMIILTTGTYHLIDK